MANAGPANSSSAPNTTPLLAPPGTSFNNVATYSTDASGNPIGLNLGGALIPIPYVVTTSVGTQTITLSPGEHNSIALGSNGYYKLDPDMDVYVRGSDSSSLIGIALANATDAYATTTGSLAAQTGLNFGTSSFSIEAWFSLTASTPSNSRIFGFGYPGSTELDMYCGANGNGFINYGIGMNDSAGATIKSVFLAATSYPVGSTLYQMVVTVARAAALGTATITYYINGTQVGTQTFTEAGSVQAFNINDNVNASAKMVLGGTVGSSPQFNGRIEDLKFYKTLLSLAQVQARNGAGPLRNPATTPIDSADASLSWWINFQQSGSWGNALYPEVVLGYGNSVFNTKIGNGSVSGRSGGNIATNTDSKVYGGKPQVVYSQNVYTGLYTDSLSAGTVRFTKVA